MAINIPIVSSFNDRGLKQAQSGFQKFSSSLKSGLRAATIGAAAVLAVGAIGARFAKMAEEANKANARLDQIAASMGIFGTETTKVTDRLKAYADANKFVFGADDELIKATQAKLLTFKELAKSADVAGGAFDRATKVAFDMAAVFGGDGSSNAVKLGKALQDPIKGVSALTRVGVTFTQAEKDKIRAMVESGETLAAQEFILSAIEQQVGGTAEATATASTKMNIAFGEIGEAIGSAVLPMFEAFANWIVEITPQLEAFFGSLTDPTTEVGEAWLGMSSSVIAFGDTIATVWGQIDSSGIFTGILKLIEGVMIGLSQLVWVAGDAGKTLGMLFSGDFAGAGAQFTSFFTRYNAFVDQLYKKIDTGVADLAAKEAARKKAAASAAVAANTGTLDSIKKTTGGAGKKSESISAALKREARMASRETKLLNTGISAGFTSMILKTAKSSKAFKKVLGGLTKTSKSAAKAQAKFNKTKAGKKELASIASAEAAAAAQAAAAERARLEEKKRVYNSFLDSVKSTFGQIRDAIMGAFNITELGSSTESIIRNMKKLIATTRSFSQNITQLSTMGLDPALLQQVIAAGPMAGAQLAAALVAGGASAIQEISAGFGEFSGLATNIATTGVQSAFGTQAQQNIYNINVNGGVGSGPTIGQAIVEAIKAYERTSGAVWQGA